MKSSKLLFIIYLICIANLISSQEFAIDKGALFINGMGSFSSQGGDLFEDEHNSRATIISLSPALNYFVRKGFFIGGSMEFSSQSQSDISMSGIGIGPHIGYAIGNPASKAFPYFNGGLRYYSMSVNYGVFGDANAAGIDIFFGFGVIVPVVPYVGVVFEAGYHSMNLNDKDADTSYSGNIFGVAVGIVGLIY
jgi:hypothetical protein